MSIEYYDAYEGFSEAENKVYMAECGLIKQLLIEYDNQKGNPFIANDDSDDTYIRLNEERENEFLVECCVCHKVISKGWESFDNPKTNSYCDDHVKIMN